MNIQSAHIMNNDRSQTPDNSQNFIKRSQNMKPSTGLMPRILGLALLVSVPMQANAGFVSGSTGVDGVLAPTVNTQLQLPADGIFNYTSINIPSGVTVTFLRNTTNTPVTLLVSGDVNIAGTVDISGQPGFASGSAGDGNTGDDGLPGVGGPGGFDGGRGGVALTQILGSSGLGPGGGGLARGANSFSVVLPCGGAGGGYASVGDPAERNSGSRCGLGDGTVPEVFAQVGLAYGSSSLLPLIGGSGGGGGFYGTTFNGSGGGGGGGAILIAASGTINVTGNIQANGGAGGQSDGGGFGAFGGGGGGGSGGAIRIIATSITGEGDISAIGGERGFAPASSPLSGSQDGRGGRGSVGRIRLESENITRVSGTTPTLSFAEPQEVFVAGLPALRITSVAGVSTPAIPTGSADISLPQSSPNPVDVLFVTSGVPIGNTVVLTVTPASGSPISVVSSALTGAVENASAVASVTLPDGPSVLSAQVSFTVVASLGNSLSTFAKGETVERVILASAPGAGSQTILITTSGKQYTYNGHIPAL